MIYKISDHQIGGRYFADGATFTSLEAVRKQLVSYHEIDCEDPAVLEKMPLHELLEYGSWGIEDEKGNEITL